LATSVSISAEAVTATHSPTQCERSSQLSDERPVPASSTESGRPAARALANAPAARKMASGSWSTSAAVVPPESAEAIRTRARPTAWAYCALVASGTRSAAAAQSARMASDDRCEIVERRKLSCSDAG
jgi:hypothetical protein